MNNTVIVSVDVETNGPIPGANSILSIGAAAYMDEDGSLVSTFYEKLEPIFGSKHDNKTMMWWNKNEQNRQAYREATKDPKNPAIVMSRFSSFLDSLKVYGKPVFLAYPVSFDVMFIYWYLVKLTGDSPILFNSIDLRSYYMGKTGKDFRNASKRYMPSVEFEHTHNALQDAKEQASIYFTIKGVY